MGKIFRIDHTQDWDVDNSYFLSESTFTVADWILIDLMVNKPSTKLHKILPEELLLRLFFNILPGGNTFLHKLVLNRDQNSVHVIKEGYKVAKNHEVELPMLINDRGITPLDTVLNVDPPEAAIYNAPDIDFLTSKK